MQECGEKICNPGFSTGYIYKLWLPTIMQEPGDLRPCFGRAGEERGYHATMDVIGRGALCR